MKLYEGCLLLSVYFNCLGNWRGVFIALGAAAIFAWAGARHDR